MALAAYRHLLRATRIAFEGDQHLMHAARMQARAGFDGQTQLESSSKQATDAVAHAEGVAEILKHNVVQGVQAADGQTIKLRIHEHIERGDNDTVKNPLAPGGKVKVGGV